jgi:hypothetical protein
MPALGQKPTHRDQNSTNQDRGYVRRGQWSNVKWTWDETYRDEWLAELDRMSVDGIVRQT